MVRPGGFGAGSEGQEGCVPQWGARSGEGSGPALACSSFSASVNPLPASVHNGLSEREEAWPCLGRNKGHQKEQKGAGDLKRGTVRRARDPKGPIECPSARRACGPRQQALAQAPLFLSCGCLGKSLRFPVSHSHSPHSPAAPASCKMGSATQAGGRFSVMEQTNRKDDSWLHLGDWWMGPVRL